MTSADTGVLLRAEAERHLREDEVAWLVTVTAKGMGYPTPVWFAFDGRHIVVYAEPTSRKVANVARQPMVTLHFNSDPAGSDIVVITGLVSIEPDVDPNADEAYATKYRPPMDRLGMTAVDLRLSSVRLRIVPRSVWLGDASAASDPR